MWSSSMKYSGSLAMAAQGTLAFLLLVNLPSGTNESQPIIFNSQRAKEEGLTIGHSPVLSHSGLGLLQRHLTPRRENGTPDIIQQ